MIGQLQPKKYILDNKVLCAKKVVQICIGRLFLLCPKYYNTKTNKKYEGGAQETGRQKATFKIIACDVTTYNIPPTSRLIDWN